jgi:hypothetical protein
LLQAQNYSPTQASFVALPLEADSSHLSDYIFTHY